MATVREAGPHEGRERGRRVRTLFSEIAPRYDLLNHLLSLNVDRWWRKVTVDRLGPLELGTGTMVLDACAGTLDLSLELAGREGFRGRIVALDFAHPMLVAGMGKLAGGEARPVPADPALGGDESGRSKGRGPSGASVRPVCGDGLALPFPDATFDAAMVGFGVRNLADVDRGFRELWRVLKPGGRLAVLEFTTPPNRLLRGLYLFYFHRVLPLVGRIVSGHDWAYSYLPESVKDFPGPDEVAWRLGAAGFDAVSWGYLTGGITALHLARKED